MKNETRSLLTLACKRLRKLYAVVKRFTKNFTGIEGWKEEANEGGKVNYVYIDSENGIFLVKKVLFDIVQWAVSKNSDLHV